MAPSTFVLLSGMLTFGVPLALALRELRELKRPPPGGWSPPPAEPAPIPKRPKPLPDCLIPAPMTQRTRILEDA